MGVLLATAVNSDAADPLPTIAGPAAATQTAAAQQPLTADAVSIYQTGAMTNTVRDSALAAAAAAGVPAVVGRGFSIGLTRVRRGSTVIQQSTGAGWAFPMSVTALPPDAIGAVMGRAVSGPITSGQVVMGQSSADLRGAHVGDTLDLVAANGAIKTFTIGGIFSDDIVGDTEIVMSIAESDILGANVQTRVLMYGISTAARTQVDSQIASRGLTGNTKIRVRRSWDAFDPDLTLSMIETKQIMGEFDYDYAHITADGWTAMNPAWVSHYLPTRDTYPTGIKARCNIAIKADLTAALAEVQRTYPGLIGVTSGIDVTNTNTYGGCGTGTVRFSRTLQNIGSISRHSWGQPIDISTAANCQGCTPKMDCRIVRIFRSHDFAWGGNFLLTDGMHFEWVGTPRNGFLYASRFCPNLPGGAIQTLRPGPTMRGHLFGDDGWALDVTHDSEG